MNCPKCGTKAETTDNSNDLRSVGLPSGFNAYVCQKETCKCFFLVERDGEVPNPQETKGDRPSIRAFPG
jgi:hypothetical protein